MYALIQRAKIYADYLHVITPLKNLREQQYIYIIKPVKADDEDGAEWQEALTEVKDELNRLSAI